MSWRQVGSVVIAAILLAGCTGSATRAPSSRPNSDGAVPATEPAALARPVAAATHTPGPTAPPPTATPAPRVLTICLGSEPATLYLYGTSGYAARLIRELVYDGPIDTRGYELQPVILEKLPSLADGDAVLEAVAVQPGDMVVDATGEVVSLTLGVEVSPAGCRSVTCTLAYDGKALEMDRMAAIFTLRPGLHWSDGKPLTAADSVLSYAAARQAAAAPGLVPAERTVDAVPRTARYAALGERTVLWVGLPGYLDPYYQANFFSPLPSHRLAALPAERLRYDDASARLPLGWGPYVLTDWQPGGQIVADRNPLYDPAPYFDRLVFRFTGQDAGRNLAALQAGECDLLAQDTLPGVDPATLLALEEAGEMRLYPGTSTTWEHLDFGINPATELPADVFEDVRVRQAVAHCIDREALARQLYGRLAQPMLSHAPPGHPATAGAGLPRYEFDPAKGQALLDAAGWRDLDRDGVREAHGVAGIAEGTRLSVRYQAPASGEHAELVGRIAADLAACGLGVTLSLPSAAEFFAPGESGLLYGRRFDLAGQASLATADLSCARFLSSQVPAKDNGWTGQNVSGYASPAYDAACRAALATLPGTESFVAAQQQVLHILGRDVPVLPLLMRYGVVVARPDLAGLRPDPSEPAETWNVEEFRFGP